MQERIGRCRAMALLAAMLGLTTACGLNHVPPPLLPPPPGLGPLRVSADALNFGPTRAGKISDTQTLIVTYDPPSKQPGFMPKLKLGSSFAFREYCENKPIPRCRLKVLFTPAAAGQVDEDLTLQQPWADRPDRPALHVHLAGIGVASR